MGAATRNGGEGRWGQEKQGGASYNNAVAGEAASPGWILHGPDRGVGGPKFFSSRYTTIHLLLLAAPGLSGSTRNLQLRHVNSSLWHVGSTSPNRS